MEAVMEFLQDLLDPTSSPTPEDYGDLVPILISSLTVMSHWATGKEELSKMRADLLPLFPPLLRRSKDGGLILEELCEPLDCLLEDEFLTQDAQDLGLTRRLEGYLEEMWQDGGVREESRLVQVARVVLKAQGRLPGTVQHYLLDRGWELPGLMMDELD